MKAYTIGALFNPLMTEMLLILKTKPEWQKGNYNFPGGKIEEGETSLACIRREFKEETDLFINDWIRIGVIESDDYFVDFYTAICSTPSLMKSNESEKCKWFPINDLPKNIISNLYWLIPFAKNYWLEGNCKGLYFGTFNYI